MSTPSNLVRHHEPQARENICRSPAVSALRHSLSHIPNPGNNNSESTWQLHYCFHDADNNALPMRSAPCRRDRVNNIHVSAFGSRLDPLRPFADPSPNLRIPAAWRRFNEAGGKAAAERHRCPLNNCTLSSLSLRIKAERRLLPALARSGREFTVPQDMTILQVIENNKAGEGWNVCAAKGGHLRNDDSEGEADHRDQYWRSEEEKASQQRHADSAASRQRRPVSAGFNLLSGQRRWPERQLQFQPRRSSCAISSRLCAEHPELDGTPHA